MQYPMESFAGAQSGWVRDSKPHDGPMGHCCTATARKPEGPAEGPFLARRGGRDSRSPDRRPPSAACGQPHPSGRLAVALLRWLGATPTPPAFVFGESIFTDRSSPKDTAS
jgi:hypothetical protein